MKRQTKQTPARRRVPEQVRHQLLGIVEADVKELYEADPRPGGDPIEDRDRTIVGAQKSPTRD
jgi:hypothetical protein